MHCKLDKRQIEDGRKRRERTQQHELTTSSPRMKGERREGEKKEVGHDLYMGLSCQPAWLD
jgi:hypothetical protein